MYYLSVVSVQFVCSFSAVLKNINAVLVHFQFTMVQFKCNCTETAPKLHRHISNVLAFEHHAVNIVVVVNVQTTAIAVPTAMFSLLSACLARGRREFVDRIAYVGSS